MKHDYNNRPVPTDSIRDLPSVPSRWTVGSTIFRNWAYAIAIVGVIIIGCIIGWNL